MNLQIGVTGTQNELPHVLTATLDYEGWGGVRWALECPYEGVRECGILVPCSLAEHEGPGPSPSEPHSDPLSQAWLDWYEAFDAWREACPSDGHPGEQCWYAYMINGREEEPEYFLAEMPRLPITGPIRVAVHTTGFDDDQQIHLYPFETPQEGTDG